MLIARPGYIRYKEFSELERRVALGFEKVNSEGEFLSQAKRSDGRLEIVVDKFLMTDDAGKPIFRRAKAGFRQEDGKLVYYVVDAGSGVELFEEEVRSTGIQPFERLLKADQIIMSYNFLKNSRTDRSPNFIASKKERKTGRIISFDRSTKQDLPIKSDLSDPDFLLSLKDVSYVLCHAVSAHTRMLLYRNKPLCENGYNLRAGVLECLIKGALGRYLIPVERRDFFLSRLKDVVEHRGVGNLLAECVGFNQSFEFSNPAFWLDTGDIMYVMDYQSMRCVKSLIERDFKGVKWDSFKIKAGDFMQHVLSKTKKPMYSFENKKEVYLRLEKLIRAGSLEKLLEVPKAKKAEGTQQAIPATQFNPGFELGIKELAYVLGHKDIRSAMLLMANNPSLMQNGAYVTTAAKLANHIENSRRVHGTPRFTQEKKSSVYERLKALTDAGSLEQLLGEDTEFSYHRHSALKSDIVLGLPELRYLLGLRHGKSVRDFLKKYLPGKDLELNKSTLGELFKKVTDKDSQRFFWRNDITGFCARAYNLANKRSLSALLAEQRTEYPLKVELKAFNFLIGLEETAYAMSYNGPFAAKWMLSRYQHLVVGEKINAALLLTEIILGKRKGKTSEGKMVQKQRLERLEVLAAGYANHGKAFFQTIKWMRLLEQYMHSPNECYVALANYKSDIARPISQLPMYYRAVRQNKQILEEKGEWAPISVDDFRRSFIFH